MAKITAEELQQLSENFDPLSLRQAVRLLDSFRRGIGNANLLTPSGLRDDLLHLHRLAVAVIDEGQTDKAHDLFDFADGLEMQLGEMIEMLTLIEQTVNQLTELWPESLLED